MLEPAPNLDLGRPLCWADIRDKDSQPIGDDDSGVYCYLCQEDRGFRQEELQPLTRSSGVFTRLVLCQEGAPVYVCLDHVPYNSAEFDSFTPEVAQLLQLARRAREDAYRAQRKASRPEGAAR